METLNRLISHTAKKLDLPEELVEYVIKTGYMQQLRYYITHPDICEEIYIKNFIKFYISKRGRKMIDKHKQKNEIENGEENI